jgi:hypothetical protein
MSDKCEQCKILEERYNEMSTLALQHIRSLEKEVHRLQANPTIHEAIKTKIIYKRDPVSTKIAAAIAEYVHARQGVYNDIDGLALIGILHRRILKIIRNHNWSTYMG